MVVLQQVSRKTRLLQDRRLRGRAGCCVVSATVPSVSQHWLVLGASRHTLGGPVAAVPAAVHICRNLLSRPPLLPARCVRHTLALAPVLTSLPLARPARRLPARRTRGRSTRPLTAAFVVLRPLPLRPTGVATSRRPVVSCARLSTPRPAAALPAAPCRGSGNPGTAVRGVRVRTFA